MMVYKDVYAGYKQRFDEAMTTYLSQLQDIPEPLFSAMKYSVQAGGKRIRPVLCLASCALFTDNVEVAIPLAISAELIHTYSLIHDDLPCMDDDDLRRGRPTCHKIYGEGMAVLAGDGLLNLAYENILGSGKTDILFYQAGGYLANCAGGTGMVGGQCADLRNEKGEPSLSEVEYIHIHKTSKLLEGSVLSGACVGGASESELHRLSEYCRYLGLAFQIRDDILDVTSSVKVLGKNVGMDENKLTYPKVVGMDRSEMLAEEYTQKAFALLNYFEHKGEFLQKLTQELLYRQK